MLEWANAILQSINSPPGNTTNNTNNNIGDNHHRGEYQSYNTGATTTSGSQHSNHDNDNDKDDSENKIRINSEDSWGDYSQDDSYSSIHGTYDERPIGAD